MILIAVVGVCVIMHQVAIILQIFHVTLTKQIKLLAQHVVLKSFTELVHTEHMYIVIGRVHRVGLGAMELVILGVVLIYRATAVEQELVTNTE